MTQQVVIVGGGLAGLAAAAALGQRGIRVKLLESRPRLGGRASSFIDGTTGELIDNCQHVSMGCCTNLQHFWETTGLAGFMRREPVLYFIGPDNRINRFAANRLPAPLHLLGAFRSLSYLSREDLLAIARGLRSLARTSSSSGSFTDWLKQQRQTPAAIERFWHVVLVSALSESLDRIDVGHARKVFVDGFLANRKGWQVEIPTVPLNDLYGERLTEWLTRHGVEISLGEGVQRVIVDNDAVRGVELRNGESVAADDLILAVPQYLVASMLPPELQAHSSITRLAGIETAPISSVHLWFDRSITDLPHAVLVGRLSQWMFNRNALHAQQTDDGRHYYQVVISASRELAAQSQEETIAAVVGELATIWPGVREAQLLHSRRVTEHRAVFSVLPGIDAIRPPQQSPIANLQFAGDWTATGWPATMEGAVRSGYLAAENVLKRVGRPERLLQPDLPVGWLPRLLFGI